MPHSKCPVCGSMFHLSISLPLDEWYRQYWPQIKVGDAVPGLCPRCWIDLRPGHRITVRTVPTELESDLESGTEGVVAAVETGPEPIYLVEFAGAKVSSGRFPRADLFYVLGQTPHS